MTVRSKSVLIAAPVAAALLLAAPVNAAGLDTDGDAPVRLAHMPGMGPGYGMGPGMMHRGFGRGAGPQGRPCAQGAAIDRDLEAEDVRKMLEGRLAWRGNDRLKVGKVEAKDDDTIVAEIVTVDDSLVERFEVDRRTGRFSRAR